MVTRAEAEELKPNDKPLSALTKTEASEWLRSLGEEPRVKWTSVEIKSRIKEILDLLVEDDSKLPKNMTRMTKANLQHECTERNIHYTEHETRGSMMRKIREKVEAEKGGKDGSVMGFGKFSEMTYEEVAEQQPAYVKWALETVKEEGHTSDAKLKRFATWLSNRDKGAEKPPKTENQRQSSAAASSARTPDGRGSYQGRRNMGIKRVPDKDPDAMKAEIPLLEETPIPENNMQKQVLGALEKLDKRLNSLETVQNQQEKRDVGTSDGSWQHLPPSRTTEG